MPDNDGDSPLSTASNILSLLTFTLGFITLVVTFLSIAHSADREVKDLNAKLTARATHISQIEDHFQKLYKEAHSDLEGSEIKKGLWATIESIKGHLEQAQAELEKNGSKHYLWWYNRPDIMGTVDAIETQFQHLNTLQLTFLLITTRSQQDDIASVEARIIEVKREIRNHSAS
ncbi:hypothetical protein B0T20DRAFT_172711 [Sordaria brevicollis]|uniref:Uncharacterized protein n=1 Tax=Sordaria brevicollis TaxID=83679 RepID=A0AAE0PHG0_SORBR|nr:hypothetical protein B0T20DRAFT_172711 [Sordaria brevicollis]